MLPLNARARTRFSRRRDRNINVSFNRCISAIGSRARRLDIRRTGDRALGSRSPPSGAAPSGETRDSELLAGPDWSSSSTNTPNRRCLLVVSTASTCRETKTHLADAYLCPGACSSPDLPSSASRSSNCTLNDGKDQASNNLFDSNPGTPCNRPYSQNDQVANET